MDHEAAAPPGAKALDDVYSYVIQSGLPQALLDLVYLRISQINGCAYMDMHSRDLLKAGVMIERVALLPAWREENALFSQSERAALAWAETVTRVAETGVPDAEYEDVAAVFDQKQLADLTIAIGLINAYNRLAICFRARRLRPTGRALIEWGQHGADRKTACQILEPAREAGQETRANS